ncbi:hypothetical protein QOT17_024540 [Balamuthia mandrillaris]
MEAEAACKDTDYYSLVPARFAADASPSSSFWAVGVTTACVVVVATLFYLLREKLWVKRKLLSSSFPGSQVTNATVMKGGSMPIGLEAYKRTKQFTKETVPSGLLKEHTTRENTWGLLHVREGRLALHYLPSEHPPQEERVVELLAGECGVIAPKAPHQVEFLPDEAGPVSFFVEFLRPIRELPAAPEGDE